MKYICNNDLHIHSHLSLCSGEPEQTNERILRYALENGLNQICLTNHFWDDAVPGATEWYEAQNYAHISEALPLPCSEGVEFLFGCEADMDKFYTLGISDECFDKFDFVIISTTHLHMKNFTFDEADDTPEKKAELWVRRLDTVLNMNLPFYKIGIAHPASKLMSAKREDYKKLLDLIPQSEMERLFSKAADLGCGIEINYNDMIFDECEKDSVLRIFETAKKCGCKFYLGSDAHRPAVFEKAKEVFENAVDMLDLTENDKFCITKR